MEKNMHTSTSLEINFDDVFGGPPRFVALISASHSGTSPSAMLDKGTARTSSFRISSLPVFDLPVFGHDASAHSVYDSRATSKVYDDMFDEEGPLRDNVVVPSLHFGSRSKPSSRSSSRRMSPVHPSFASSGGQSGGDDKLLPKTRPVIGRLSKRGALSSASSCDESGGKPAETVLSGSAGAMDGINMATLQSFMDSDDVFGGYQQRSFTQLFSAVPNTSDSLHGKGVASGKSGLKFFSSSDASKTHDATETVLSRSSSIKDDKEEREKQVWMARQTDSPVSESSELAAGKTSITSHDGGFSRQSSSERLQAESTPGLPLRHKSWKDLLSDPPAGRAFTSRRTVSPMPPATEEVEMDNDVFVEKHMISQAQQEHGKPCHSSAATQTGKVDCAEYSAELEERELQALLSNVSKFNERVEREKYSTKFPVQITKHFSHIEQHELGNEQEKDNDVNWREWRKFCRGQASNNESTIGDSPVGFKTQADQDANRGGTEQGQIQGRSDGLRKNASFHGFTSILSQGVLYNGEQSRSCLTAEMEDTESLLAFTVGFAEIEGETSERRKSRWERHVRARKRAEKALEEMQQRDAELQRQEKEKEEFSESSDEKINRWAAGKEGNLRALLSNLQHVLWPEWQPVPLSELIEVPDVKKAFRKATLFVHPDKMQQKGATMQQKYIAERVFNILQAAWKTFSLQESF